MSSTFNAANSPSLNMPSDIKLNRIASLSPVDGLLSGGEGNQLVHGFILQPVDLSTSASRTLTTEIGQCTATELSPRVREVLRLAPPTDGFQRSLCGTRRLPRSNRYDR